MSALEHVTVSELQTLLASMHLPSDTRVTVTFEDGQVSEAAVRREKALAALRKLRGSGNGRLVTALLREREKDARL